MSPSSASRAALTLAVTGAALFMTALDSFVVGVALWLGAATAPAAAADTVGG